MQVKRIQIIAFTNFASNNQPIELATYNMMEQRLAYLHNNPVEAGWVEKPEDYLYSSARDYCGVKGLLPITFIE